ncbi:AAA family ATPase [Nonomuraea sp. 3-1Str]|uniref:nucleotide-binding protein n=1 Tax=Nonomuraea sp. 3-1Str TaxID=2929801 RepID=UPI002859A6A0|nr:AAA family ATPase [Nonomuraea sp. 3-1Str]MDR8407874.1 AAA family ATPase [Nonomuraea sp. 3-1Str]
MARHDREESLEEQLAWLDAIKESEEASVPAGSTGSADEPSASPYPQDPWRSVTPPDVPPQPLFRAAAGSMYSSNPDAVDSGAGEDEAGREDDASTQWLQPPSPFDQPSSFDQSPAPAQPSAYDQPRRTGAFGEPSAFETPAAPFDAERGDERDERDNPAAAGAGRPDEAFLEPLKPLPRADDGETYPSLPQLRPVRDGDDPAATAGRAADERTAWSEPLEWPLPPERFNAFDSQPSEVREDLSSPDTTSPDVRPPVVWPSDAQQSETRQPDARQPDARQPETRQSETRQSEEARVAETAPGEDETRPEDTRTGDARLDHAGSGGATDRPEDAEPPFGDAEPLFGEAVAHDDQRSAAPAESRPLTHPPAFGAQEALRATPDPRPHDAGRHDTGRHDTGRHDTSRRTYDTVPHPLAGGAHGRGLDRPEPPEFPEPPARQRASQAQPPVAPAAPPAPAPEPAPPVRRPSRPAPIPVFTASPRPPVTGKPTAESLDPETLLRGRRNAPSKGWRRLVYKASGGWIKPGEPPEVRRRRELLARARTPVATGHHRVAVLSLKGGVGKTTTTVGLGATLAQTRGDRVIAVDANPDRGTLSDKLVLETSATVRDLLNERDQVKRYVDIRAFTSQAPSRLEVLASDRDPSVSEAFSGADYQSVSQVLENFYSICITDCGTGLLHSAMGGVLGLADQIVLVSSPSVDGARAASATLDWLEAHHYGDLVRDATVVLCSVRPRTKSAVDLNKLEAHFAARCRAVIRVPYDPHLEEGAEIDLDRLQEGTRDAFLQLAAYVGDGFAGMRESAAAPGARD